MRDNIVKEYALENVTLWLISSEEASAEELKEMHRLCGVKRREKTERIRPEGKRRESVCAGYLLYLLMRRFSIEEEPVLLGEGKPVFQNAPEVHFSISHSAGFVVLGFGNRELGVDIERVKRANLKVAKRFYTKEEYAYLLETKEEEQGDGFFRIWTGKEAVVKAAGCGLSVSPKGFCVLGEEAELEGVRYALWRKRLEIGGRAVWICVAQ